MLSNPLVINNLHEYQNRFGKAQITVIAPGRVNIIGEHTDYNGGDVLPFAISQAVFLTGNTTNTSSVKVYSSLFDEELILSNKPKNHWSSLLDTTIKVLQDHNHIIGGFSVVIGGNLIHGSGLSSSSALCVGFIQLMNQLFQLKLTDKDLINLASRAENANGVIGGIMDQSTIVHGKENNILLINCEDALVTNHRLQLQGHEWLVIDSKVKHNLAETDYNIRNLESKKALEILRKNNVELKTYRDVSEADLDILRKENPTYYNRAMHFVLEQNRVQKMLRFLNENQMKEAGQVLYEGHQSLKELYEVSCKEIDFLIDQLKDIEEVMGARMMGGGFGGSIISLIKRDSQRTILNKLKPVYQEAFNKELNGYLVEPKDGLKVIYHA